MDLELLERVNRVSLRVARALEESEKIRAMLCERINEEVDEGSQEQSEEEESEQQSQEDEDSQEESEEETEEEIEEEKVQDNELSACWFCCNRRR